MADQQPVQKRKGRFGTGIGRQESILDIGKYAAAAERYAFEHLGFVDDIHQNRDVYAMLAVAAMSTSKILIGPGVTNPNTRHPVQTAVATATIQELSKGRAFLGLGAGYLNPTIGLRPGTIAEMRRAVDVSRALCQGRKVEIESGVTISSPWMKTPFPIYLAADGPRSMQLGGEIADAVWTHGFHPRLMEWRFANIEKGAETANRKREDVRVWLRTVVVISDRKDEARELVRAYVATIARQFCLSNLVRDTDDARTLRGFLPSRMLDEYLRILRDWPADEPQEAHPATRGVASDELVEWTAIVGTARECAATIRQLFDAGYDGLSLRVFGRTDTIAFWREFHESVMPLV